MTTTQKTVGAGALLLFLIAGLGSSGYFDRFAPEEKSFVAGVEITQFQKTLLVNKAYAMKESGKFETVNDLEANPKEISPDDWELFRQTITDPSKLTNVQHIGALIRLLRTSTDHRLQEILRELLCQALPEICGNLPAIQKETPKQEERKMRGPKLDDLQISPRLYNALRNWAGEKGGNTLLEEILMNMAKEAKEGESITYVFLKGKNVGKKSLIELEETINDVDPSLIEDYFN